MGSLFTCVRSLCGTRGSMCGVSVVGSVWVCGRSLLGSVCLHVETQSGGPTLLSFLHFRAGDGHGDFSPPGFLLFCQYPFGVTPPDRRLWGTLVLPSWCPQEN